MKGGTGAFDGSLARNKVIVIEAAEKPETQKLRVAAYARVSTDSEDQANSFLAQMEYYTRLIASNENWTLVDVYADRGISGTSAKKRPDFQRMLADCRQGRIDKILVKSISRFARNTKECLEIVRELKAIGVGVCFEEQDIDTGRMTGELLTAVFAALAQKESESISQNMRWSYHARMTNGTFLPGSMAYGYRIEKRQIVIDPEKAETVRRIFRDYLAGYGLLEITKRLNADGIPVEENSDKRWTINAVSYILSNERYIGDSLWQKKYATDDLPAKKVRNRGEREQYYAAGTQEAIVDQEAFAAVQELRKRRSEHPPREGQSEDLLRGKLRCGACGSTVRKHTSVGKTYYTCRKHFRDKDSCPVVQIPESEARSAFLRLYHKLKWHGGEVLSPLIRDLREVRKRKLLWSEDIIELNKRISEISEQNQLLSSMNRMGLVDPDIFITRSNEFAQQLREAKQKRAKLLEEGSGDDTLQKTEDLLDELEAMPEFLTEFDDAVFDVLVERVELPADDRLMFRLTNGLCLTERIKRGTRA